MVNYNNLKALDFNRQLVSRLQDICNPFLASINCNLFVYARFYEDGKIFRLCNDLAWTEEYFNHFYYNEVNFYNEQIQEAYKKGETNFLKFGNPTNKFNSALYDYGIWNMLTIARKNEGSVECFCFGAPLDNDAIISFYVSNLPIVERFILYFMDKAQDLVDSTQSNFPFIMADNFCNDDIKENFSDASSFSLLSKIPVNRYKFEGNIFLTNREAECLCLLMKGMSSKQIAGRLGISPRTVETYLAAIKTKLNCHSKTEIVDKAIGSVFDNKLAYLSQGIFCDKKT